MADPTESNKITVKMSDGRDVEFSPKRKISKDVTVNDDGSFSVRFDFINGETRTVTSSDVAGVIAHLAAHGAAQKLGDTLAGEESLDDGILSFDETLDRLKKNEWTATRAKGSNAGASILLRAVCEAKGKTTPEEIATVKEWLAGKSQAEKLALRKLAAIAPIIARLESDKAKKSTSSVNIDDLTADLDSLDAPAKAKKAA